MIYRHFVILLPPLSVTLLIVVFQEIHSTEVEIGVTSNAGFKRNIRRENAIAGEHAVILGSHGDIAYATPASPHEQNSEKLRDNFHCSQWPHEAPTKCPQDNTHWSMDQLRAALPEFAKVYATRPIQRNDNGMGVNHAFALWFAAHALKPKYVIESGVYRGQSTFLLRQAVGPEAHIFSLDPEANTTLAYRDVTDKTHYFLGSNFVDLGVMNWDELIPWADRNQTLVMLDDHQSCIKRVQELLAHGFVHLWYDDNWKRNADCYSFSWVCSPLPHNMISVPYLDAGSTRNITLQEHYDNFKYLSEHMETYFEFPAIMDGCQSGNPTLFGDVSDVILQGLPSFDDEVYGYWSLHPPYVKLKLSNTTWLDRAWSFFST